MDHGCFVIVTVFISISHWFQFIIIQVWKHPNSIECQKRMYMLGLVQLIPFSFYVLSRDLCANSTCMSAFNLLKSEEYTIQQCELWFALENENTCSFQVIYAETADATDSWKSLDELNLFYWWKNTERRERNPSIQAYVMHLCNFVFPHSIKSLKTDFVEWNLLYFQYNVTGKLFVFMIQCIWVLPSAKVQELPFLVERLF